MKNDKAGAATLAQLLRADLLPEAWIAPAGVRQLRALLRHRAGLVRLRTGLQNRIHAVVAGDAHPTVTNLPRTGPSPPPMIHRRSQASSSPVPAAARLRALQLDPSRAAT